jgi:hypothetical protein
MVRLKRLGSRDRRIVGGLRYRMQGYKGSIVPYLLVLVL